MGRLCTLLSFGLSVLLIGFPRVGHTATEFLLVPRKTKDLTKEVSAFVARIGGLIDYEGSGPHFWRVQLANRSKIKVEQTILIEGSKYGVEQWEWDQPLVKDDDPQTAEANVTSQAAESRDVATRLPIHPTNAVPNGGIPNDPYFGEQYHLLNVGQLGGEAGADVDWMGAVDYIAGGPETRVAVCDDGTDTDHPDLQGRLFINPGEVPGDGIDNDNNGFVDDVSGWDFNGGDPDPRPDIGAQGRPDHHGTQTAGVLAAEVNNRIGIAGAGPTARLIPLKIDGSVSVGFMSSLVRAIDYALQLDVRVISVSYNIDPYSPALEAAIARARARDVIYVNSAGNAGRNIDLLRGMLRRRHSNVVLVGATDRFRQLVETSNFGLTVDVVAPGRSIFTLSPGGRYATNSGTSFAAPIVAGALALLRSRYPNETHQEILRRMTMSALPLPSPSVPLGGGLLRIGSAVRL